MRFDKTATAAFALLFFLAEGARAQGCSSPSLPSTEQGSTTMSNEAPSSVIMRVQISKSGVVHDMKVLSGPPALTAAAIKAVKQWKYEPPYWVTGSPSERQSTLVVTLVKGAAPKVEEGMPAGIPGCIPAPTRVRISQVVMQQRLLSRIEPVYPPDAQTEHIEGIVVVRVIIDKGGNVSKADSVSGPPALLPAAVEAIKQWKYQPFLLNGDLVEVETTVEISSPR